MEALRIEHLRKSYGATAAVDDVSFEIERGEFFGFLGPNGAGKTTTIHCITGISRIDFGSVKLFGIDAVRDYRAARFKVGLSPQEYNADFFASTYKTLDYVAGYYGIPSRKRKLRINELLERFGLVGHANKPFRELSGGFKRRVMLARAMVHDPDLLILDEPTAGVDVELRHELWRHLRELNQAGKTILLTSHYLEEVEMLSSRIAIINRGKIVAIGDKSEFVKDGKNLEKRYLEITQGESW